MKRLSVVLVLLMLLGCAGPPPEAQGPKPEETVWTPLPQSIGSDPVRFIGSIDLVAKDRRGRVKEERHVKNLVVDAGKAGVAGLIIATGFTDAFDHIGIGTGTTAEAAGNTGCETEITTNGGQRALATLSRVTTDVTNDTAQAEVTYAFTGSFAVTESCFMSAISAGTMLSRQKFSAINVISGDSLLIRWKIDVD